MFEMFPTVFTVNDLVFSGMKNQPTKVSGRRRGQRRKQRDC